MDKKLIYIINHYSHNSVQHFFHIINLLKVMADRGVKIALIIEKCDDIPNINHKNIEIITQKEKGKLRRTIELYRILTELILKGYKKIFIRISVNAALVSILAARVKGASTYYWHSGTTLEIDKNKRFIQKFKWKVYDYSRFYFVKKFTSYFVSGPETMIKYYTEIVKVDPAKMVLLYNDIDTDRFTLPQVEERGKVRKQLGLEKNSKIILVVHRLSPVRKTDYYIPFIVESKLMDDLNAYLVIVGDGPEKQLLDKLISNSQIKERIIMVGNRPNSEIEQYYKAADVFVNPSYTEGFPRVVIEAMASGLPIVATNAGGTLDIMGEKQKQFIVDRNDRDKFRECIFELLINAPLQKELSSENIERVKRYSTSSVCDMYIERIFNNG
jgi:glycosyltransferase involved in cell wall biosynthesis